MNNFKIHTAFLYLLFSLIASVKAYCQSILITNPSFEEELFLTQFPNGWKDCGFLEESPPDVQPGFFSVTTLPKEGSSYLGMVVRDNKTWEAIGQLLLSPLKQNNAYNFSVDLCRSIEYSSFSRTTYEPVSYSDPVKLRIWGGNEPCNKQELLFETPVIANLNWTTFNIKVQPQKSTYSCIIFEAYYKSSLPYNGNILVDNITPLIPINAVIDTSYLVKTEEKKIGKVVASPKIFRLEELKTDAKAIKKGDIVQLQNLYFDADKAILKPACEPVLKDIYSFLMSNPMVTIEIGGHTNNYPTDVQANELSLKRAKAVTDWLINKGITANRIQFKGYGKTQPLTSNTTLEGREKNQRVEIKIINIK